LKPFCCPPARLYLLHTGLPGAFKIGGVATGQIRAGKVQVQGRLALCLVAGVKQAAGFALVFSAEAGLLAGGGGLAIIDLAAPEKYAFRFHRHDSESCPEVAQHVRVLWAGFVRIVAEWWQIVNASAAPLAIPLTVAVHCLKLSFVKICG
jgi:hypothetical protein